MFNFLSTKQLAPDDEDQEELFSFLSSRMETDTFTVAIKEIRASTDDIHAYAELKLREASRPRSKFANLLIRTKRDIAELKKNIIDAVVSAAGTLFLLAVLQLNSIIGTSTVNQLDEALVNLPKTLTAQFDIMQKRIQSQTENLEDRDAAERALSWICAAARPMSLAELQHALAINAPTWMADEGDFRGESDIITLCAGFLILPEDRGVSEIAGQHSLRLENRTVEFVHSTAKEHIREKLLGSSTIQQMAEVCIGYLDNGQLVHPTCESDEELEERLERSKFLLYAACSWGHHLRLHEGSPTAVMKKSETGGQEAPEATVTNMAVHMLGTEEVLLNLSQLMHIPTYKQPGYHRQFPRSMTALHFAAQFDVLRLTQELLAINASKFLEVDGDLRAQKNVPNESQDDPDAFVQTSGDTVKYIDAKDTYMKTAMHVAARRGHASIVETLIHHGAKFEETTGDGETPLLSGAMNGDFRVVQVLLSKGADVHKKNKPGGTALHWASLNGNPEVIAELLRYEANVSEIADAKSTVYYGIETIKFEPMVWLLLDPLASAGLQHLLGGTPLHWASFNGRLEVSKLLIRHGADIHAKNAFGGTPLHAAAWNGNEKVVQVLLEQNVSLSEKNVLGVTPLRQACLAGHVTVATALLRHGADHNLESDLTSDVSDFNDKTRLAQSMTKAGVEARWADTDQGKRVLEAVVSHVVKDNPLAALAMEVQLQTTIQQRDDKKAWSALREMSAKGFEALTTLLNSIEQCPPH